MMNRRGGGWVLASLQIARAIHTHQGKVTAFVPHYAMSDSKAVAHRETDRPWQNGQRFGTVALSS